MRKIAALIFVLSCGLAHAFTIDIVSVGTFVPGINYTASEVVVYENAPGALSSLNVAGLVNNPGVSQFLTGSATWTGGSDSLTVSFVSGPVQSGSSGTAAYAGTWTYTGGTGLYAGLFGGGSWSVVFNGASNNYSNHSFSGDLNAVPEPTTLAFIGIAGSAFLARKRRARNA